MVMAVQCPCGNSRGVVFCPWLNGSLVGWIGIALRIRLYVLRKGLPRSIPIHFGWDWNPQSSSREGSGSLGLMNSERILFSPTSNPQDIQRFPILSVEIGWILSKRAWRCSLETLKLKAFQHKCEVQMILKGPSSLSQINSAIFGYFGYIFWEGE